jgi:hypothetical protein
MNKTFAALVAATLMAGTPALADSLPDGQVASLRRLNADEYRNSVADIFGAGIQVRGGFEPSLRIAGLQAASSTVLSITPTGFESYSKMADDIAVQVVAQKNRGKLPCAPKSDKAPDDACTAQTLNHYGMSLFRRPLTQNEVKSGVALAHAQAQASGDFYTGLRYGLASLIQSPNFLFREELAVPTADKQYTLEPYSRATRISYLLWNTAPDAELLHAAQAGELNTAAGLDRQVTRMIASPRLDEGMRGFFSDMLELDNFGTVAKDTLLYPKWGTAIAASAKEETLRSVLDLTLHQNGDIRDLMVTRKTILDRNMAAIYGIPFPFNGTEWMPYEFAPDSGRSGIVTQASMLAMFSHAGRTSPTERGVALMDIFLCSPTPPPPANVDFSLINDVNNPTLRTTRQRLMAHATNKTCASCHTHSDPIGLTLEGFDTIGGRRTEEDGKPIDVSGNIEGKAFNGAVGLGQFLHDNPRYPLCVARKLYAYAKGQSSADITPAMFKEAYASFTGSGYRLRTLVKGLVEAPDFFNVPASLFTPVPPKSVEAAKPATKVAAQ